MFFNQPPPEALELTNKHRQVLRDQIIDENGPGTILHDFETLLAFIGTEGIPSTGKYRLLPMKSLEEINRKLVHPIQINMTRPQQKSYPNLHGLYLLLRSTGMLRVDKEGAKAFLVIDNQMHQGWTALNPTEKYFTLLDAWMLHGSDELIGERSSFVDLPPLFKCSRFIQSLENGRMNVIKNKLNEDHLRYAVGLHHLALLELFGIVSILTDATKNTRGWRIKSVITTTLGDSLMRLFVPLSELSVSTFDDIAVGSEDGISKLMPIVQPFFPEWRKTNKITDPEYEFKDGVYIFTVTLGKVWVKISATGAMMFENLSDAILAAFGFDHEHLYQFVYRNQFGIEKHIVHPYMDDGEPTTTEIAIGDLLLVPGDTMTYQYDFGEDWDFKIHLEEVQPSNKRQKKPKILERYGKPPEQYPVWEEDAWESEG